MTQWIVRGRFTFDGHAIVEAETEAEAKQKFDAGNMEFDHLTASMCDWERHGSLEKSD